MRFRSVVWALLAAGIVVGCKDEGRPGFDFETGTDTSTTSTGTAGPQTDASTGTDSGSTGGSTTDPATTDASTSSSTSDTDTDGSGSTGMVEVVPCTGVDLLLVVDNSTDMGEKQSRLISTANAFVSGVISDVMSAAGDVNIAVITTDEPQFVVPLDGMSMPTTYASGENYMTAATLDVTELNAALDRGEAGDPNERPMDMIIEALTDEAGPTGHNAGFLRDDAMLVIVIVSDEEDDLEVATQWGSEGDPPDWIAAVADLKSGKRRDILPLAIVPTGVAACPDDMDAPRIAEFAAGFPRGATHDVCDADYATFLLGEVTEINAACNLFSPP